MTQGGACGLKLFGTIMLFAVQLLLLPHYTVGMLQLLLQSEFCWTS